MQLARVLSERFGGTVEVRPVDPTAPSEDGRALIVAGEARSVIAGVPAHADAAALLDLAGHALTVAQDRWASEVRSDVWSLLGRSGSDPAVVTTALERLRRATRSDVAGRVGYREGRFVADEFVGRVDDDLLAALARRRPDEDVPLGVAYRTGRDLFVADANPSSGDDPAPSACARSLAILPMPLEPYAHEFLVLARFAAGPWLEPERALLHDAARALQLFLASQRHGELLDAIVELERRLLAREESNPMQQIVDALVEIVPGAEAGTLLVRDGDDFRYVGVNGYDPDELDGVTFSEEELRRWHEDGRSSVGRARLLIAPYGIASASRHAVGDKLDGRGDLPIILANLGLPVEHHGRWAAFVNLDAFASPHAFLEEDRRLLETFAPIVEFVLYESDVREELRRLASHDPLTGLMNRRAFDITLQRELRRADRSRTPLTLMIMDVDEFKRLNDAFGHAAGDAALRDVADALRLTVRTSDHVFRWGGDEFAALLPDTSEEGAKRTVERLREAVATLPTPGTDLSLSVGVAVHAPGDPVDEDAFLSHADAAMYAAKRGRAR